MIASKSLRERAAKAFAELLHPQTGFIHREGMISVHDNLLYALSLYQMKTKEDGLAANELLRRLLPFCKDSFFPKYLHTYPEAPDPAITVRILLVLTHLLSYKHLMDAKLKVGIEESVHKLLQIDEEGLSFLSRLKLACIRQHLGLGQADLPEINAFDGSSSAARTDLAESFALISAPHLRRLFALYHSRLAHFCPPGYFETFERCELKKSALDALINPQVEGEALLQTPLFPEEIELAEEKESFFKGEKNGLPWSVELGDSYALALIEKGKEMVSYHAHSFYPLMLFWRGHSCVMTQPRGDLGFEKSEDSLIAHMTFTGSFAAERREARTLLSLFFDDHPGLMFKVGGQCATLFYPGDKIRVVAENRELELYFHSSAPLVLRLSQGARPSESAADPHRRGPDRVLALEALADLQEAEVAFSLKEALSTATPIACMPLST